MNGDFSLGDRLFDLRKGRKVSQQVVADFLGVHRSTIGAYEANRIRPPHETLIRLADYYGTSYSYLVGMADYDTDKIDALDQFFATYENNDYSVGAYVDLMLRLSDEERSAMIEIAHRLRHGTKVDLDDFLRIVRDLSK